MLNSNYLCNLTKFQEKNSWSTALCVRWIYFISMVEYDFHFSSFEKWDWRSGSDIPCRLPMLEKSWNLQTSHFMLKNELGLLTHTLYVQGPPYIFAPLFTLFKFLPLFQKNFKTNSISIASPNIEPIEPGKKLGVAPS